MKITVEKLTEAQISEMGINKWPVWTKEKSKFDWYYDETEQCYILEGKVTVHTDTESVTFGKDDFVTFPKGLSCTWEIHEPVRKHYQLG